jgi:hypothetical protein
MEMVILTRKKCINKHKYTKTSKRGSSEMELPLLTYSEAI